MSDWQVRVTKKGKLPGEGLRKGTCTYCSTEVEFKASAGTYSPDRRDGNAMSVPCPLCKRDIWSWA